jgi:hypothetical protein
MVFSLRVFCVVDPALTRADLVSFVEDGFYFDADPVFDPAPGADAAAEADWDALRVRWHPRRGPLVVRRVTDERRAADDVTRARAAWPGHPSASVLDAVARVFVVTLDEEDVGDSDVWALADDLGRWLASEGRGVLEVPGVELVTGEEP